MGGQKKWIFYRGFRGETSWPVRVPLLYSRRTEKRNPYLVSHRRKTYRLDRRKVFPGNNLRLHSRNQPTNFGEEAKKGTVASVCPWATQAGQSRAFFLAAIRWSWIVRAIYRRPAATAAAVAAVAACVGPCPAQRASARRFPTRRRSLRAAGSSVAGRATSAWRCRSW